MAGETLIRVQTCFDMDFFKTALQAAEKAAAAAKEASQRGLVSAVNWTDLMV